MIDNLQGKRGFHPELLTSTLILDGFDPLFFSFFLPKKRDNSIHFMNGSVTLGERNISYSKFVYQTSQRSTKIA